MRKCKGFTLVEMAVVLAIALILFVLGTVNFSRMQKQSRDNQRQSDVEAIARCLESRYTSIYTYDSSLINLATCSGAPDILTAPGNSGSTSVILGSSTMPSSVNDIYVYRPMNSDGSDCTDNNCVSFNLYYYSELSKSVKTIESKNR